MSLTKDAVRAALKTVLIPSGEDVVSSGGFQWTAICDTFVSVKLHVPGIAIGGLGAIARSACSAITRAAGDAGGSIDSVIVEFVDDHGSVIHTVRQGGATSASAPASAAAPATIPASNPAPASPSTAGAPGHRPIGGLADSVPASKASAPTPQAAARPLAGVRHIIAVGAGKGGVGKSTIAVNLAIGLARQGHMVGLMDGDIYGPSLPTLLGLAGLDPVIYEGKLQPFVSHGIKSMTIGKLVDAEKPLIWRGPMAHGAFKQLAEQTSWGELDYLIIDLPPGTGDVPLTMAQLLQLSGAVVVCTPQKVAQDDAVRATRMFQQLGITVLGVVENMSHFVCEHGTEYDIFGRGGAEMMAQRLGVPFLGAVPITPALRQNSDRGDPAANFAPGTPLHDALRTLVQSLESQVALASMRQGRARPTLTIS
ncbi:MAG: Mrp/NBP35 family ATP-binding protein [Phycisphaerales bacterium]|nr:Mrp/NBP35 family ATP-binding protein [Phycisphaerales bacterium]